MKRSLETSGPLLEQVHSSTERLQWAINMHSYLFLGPSNVYEDSKHDTKQYLADYQAQKWWLMMSYQKMVMMMKNKQLRKLNSCPSIEVDIRLLNNRGGANNDHEDANKMVPRMKMLDSTAALSVATFTSLLIEFVARLDHLVEAVDELSRLAKFKQYHAVNPI